MATIKLVKSIYTGSDVTALGELATGDTVNLPDGSQVNSEDILTDADIGVTVQAFGSVPASVASYDDATANFTGVLQNDGSNVLVDSDVGVNVQAFDSTILVDADIGVNVQAYDATLLNDSDIGVSVQAFDATLLNDADIGVNVQAYDATLLNDADIGVSVQAYDATLLNDADIGVNVQAYDATLLNDADIGVNVQAYDSTIVVDADIGVSVQAYDADTAKLDVAQTFTAAQELSTGAPIASATTINLNTATGNRVHITGTTAITGVALTRGPRTVIFDDVLTLTHHSTNNNLPGGADITTAAGDRATYESDGTVVYCVNYTKADGRAVVAGSGGGGGGGGGSTTVYATPDDLPLTGNTAGDMAYVTSTNRMYIFTGTGWYNIALINTSPTITTAGDAAYDLATDGTPTVLTLVATDPEEVPIAWSYAVTAGSLGSTATVAQSNNVFTITPSTNKANAGSFTLTFTASDGVNLDTAVSSFSLSFFLAEYNSTKTTALTTLTAANGFPQSFWLDAADEYTLTVGSNLVVDIYMWGGGGGAAAGHPTSGTNTGGAGGFTYAEGLQLAAGGYKVVVGAGGYGSIAADGYTQAQLDGFQEDFGAGGVASTGNYQSIGNRNGGGGGGFSGLFSTSISQANALIIAGGGGGGGSSSGDGGQGGIPAGADGDGPYFGYGGTQTAGGLGRGGATEIGDSGSALQGGDGWEAIDSDGFGGGGGGGGYFGGGAAGNSGLNGLMGGGGGGSGYLASSLTATTTGYETAAKRQVPVVKATDYGDTSGVDVGYGGSISATRSVTLGDRGAVKIVITGTF